MSWYLGVLSTLVGLNAQKNPVPVLLLAAAACFGLWFLVGQARRRDARKANRERDLSGWRSRQPPRY